MKKRRQRGANCEENVKNSRENPTCYATGPTQQAPVSAPQLNAIDSTPSDEALRWAFCHFMWILKSIMNGYGYFRLYFLETFLVGLMFYLWGSNSLLTRWTHIHNTKNVWGNPTPPQDIDKYINNELDSDQGKRSKQLIRPWPGLPYEEQ